MQWNPADLLAPENQPDSSCAAAARGTTVFDCRRNRTYTPCQEILGDRWTYAGPRCMRLGRVTPRRIWCCPPVYARALNSSGTSRGTKPRLRNHTWTSGAAVCAPGRALRARAVREAELVGSPQVRSPRPAGSHFRPERKRWPEERLDPRALRQFRDSPYIRLPLA